MWNVTIHAVVDEGLPQGCFIHSRASEEPYIHQQCIGQGVAIIHIWDTCKMISNDGDSNIVITGQWNAGLLSLDIATKSMQGFVNIANSYSFSQLYLLYSQEMASQPWTSWHTHIEKNGTPWNCRQFNHFYQCWSWCMQSMWSWEATLASFSCQFWEKMSLSSWYIFSYKCFWTNAGWISRRNVFFLIFIVFKDDYSSYQFVFIMTKKSEVYGYFMQLYQFSLNDMGISIVQFRNNSVQEYLSAFIHTKGICHDTTAPYSPEHNWVAERDKCNFIYSLL